MINSLTAFRFITAFVVFLFHCNMHLQWKTGIDVMDKFFSNGAIFMTGFFVLSGFIMTHVYQNVDFTKRYNIFNFYIKRFARIYPAYAFGTIAYFIYLNKEFLKAPLGVLFNDTFLVQGFFPSMFSIGLNGGTWSLTVEMFLYFLFPLLIIILHKNAKYAISLGVAMAFLVSLNIGINTSDTIYSNPIMRLADFIMGIGFYFLVIKSHSIIKEEKVIKKIHLFSLLLIFISSVLLGSSKYQYMLGQAIIIPLFGFWIFSVYYLKNFLYNNKVMVYLGKISYSFYIWQFVAIDVGKRLVELNALNLHAVILLCFVLNVVVSSISYYLIEEPFRRAIYQMWVKKQNNVKISLKDFVYSLKSAKLGGEKVAVELQEN